jgi:Ca2+-binding EF-hand superfamily protein
LLSASKVYIFALQGFMADCPDGRMDREKMKVMFKAIMPEGDAGEVFLDQLFRIFDKDGDGSIDFKVGRQVIRLVLEGYNEE